MPEAGAAVVTGGASRAGATEGSAAATAQHALAESLVPMVQPA